MRISLLRFFCVLIICFSSLVVCDAAKKEGMNSKSAKCVDIDMQVQKLSDEILKVPGKGSDYRMSYDVIMPMDAPNSDHIGKKGPSRYSIGLHLKSTELYLTLNVNVKCEPESGCTALDEIGKLLTTKDGIEISLDYKSSIPAKSCATERMTAFLDWIIWPFRSLKNMMVGAFNFLADRTKMGFHWIARQFQSLKNKIWSSIYGYLKPKIDNPIIVIEAVLEVVWFFLKPVWRTAKWLCGFMVAVNKQAKVTYAAILEKYPIVLYVIEMFQIMEGYVSSLIALWPWDWKDSIEYVGFSWVITYFMYHLLRFAAMDEREMQRIAREKDKYFAERDNL